ncbi:hypothetical protein B446_03445 [Streptomyces collinus Tu 365]|uniref:Integral-membrane protein n=1 Tax=Streptomyces collinus (strain DSM 40733 / Tue 365) TaxID=1214242 RepID=S5UP15_STRC3|nr:hypothetical protein B446_03445 [Streptomyces collinus Tu 365]
MFAVVCVLLAALAHVLMSGRHVPGWTLAAGLAVTGAAGWSLAGRERGLPLVVTAVLAAQTVLHEAFSLAQPAVAYPAGTAGTGRTHSGATGSMDMSAMGPMNGMSPTDMGSPASGDPTGHAMHGGASSLGMLAAHLLAALLCGLWLAYGERAAFRILRAVAGRLAAPLRLLLALPVPADRPRPRTRRRRSGRAPRLVRLVHSIISRGPPAGVAVA